ncbi:hypothetical protein F5Y00DRAFT_258930 [Daldinia vernicosa]|uniref:uncharacterized protein n=1 Tax=Daldinia vernicosa TaxID=114800 RepID=UPI002008A87B|nr:uncharacterized protein F5Y00DRAFT_258930 [Daldinia vernicosa]KAI0851974.1 hypothetical protein F5Y00DRAFT_258930 [Daldinia vernicosa]
MQFSTVAYLVGAILSAPLALVNAGPIPEPSLETRDPETYCCVPGCYWCAVGDCLHGGCNGFYGSCCAVGFRKVDEDGNLQIFNTNGQQMRFVDNLHQLNISADSTGQAE